MEKERYILADLNDLAEMWSSKVDVEMDEECFYASSNLFGDEPCTLRWSRRMLVDSPGSLQCMEMYYPDIYGALNKALSRYVAGLGYCKLLAHFGDLLPEKRNDEPVFMLKPATEAEHAAVVIRWAVDHPPKYDTSLEGNFAQDFGICKMVRIMPGNPGTSESFGTDVLIVQRCRIGLDFDEQVWQYDQFAQCLREQEWREFEIQRNYYRAEMEKLQDSLSMARLELQFKDDFAWLVAADAEIARKMSPDCKGIIGRCWYNETGLQQLKVGLLKLAPVVGMMNLFKGLAEVIDGLVD